MRESAHWVGLAVLFAAVSAWPQADVARDVAPPPSAAFPAEWYPADSDVEYTTAPEKGAPYRGVMVITSSGVDPATGHAVEYRGQTAQMRDSAGRTRTEESLGKRKTGDGREVEQVEVEVNDPVTHCGFRWPEPWIGEVSLTATVSCMSRTLRYDGQKGMLNEVQQRVQETTTPSGEIERSDPLGEKTISGVKALGVRRTRRSVGQTPADQTQGSVELWYSPTLKELMEMRVGPQHFELTAVKQGEPDRSLFYPPAGYRIEKGH